MLTRRRDAWSCRGAALTSLSSDPGASREDSLVRKHPSIYHVRWFWWQGPWIMNRLHVSLETDHSHHFLRALTTVDSASLMNDPT